MRRLALTTLVLNVVLVITGGAVRLTDSGLGCPTWPKCTAASYHNTSEFGIHGYIEFGNRLLTFVLVAAVVLTFLAALVSTSQRRSLIWLSVLSGATIPAQAVVGGVTVLTQLNPYTVAAHFLFTVLIIAIAYWLWRRCREGDEPAELLVARPLRALAILLTALTTVVLAIGTLVTGSGPHSGDHGAARTGLDPEMLAQLHADAVMLLIGASVAAWFAFRAVDAPHRVRRAVTVLLAVELSQGVVGFVQYFTHLPILLVGLHMAGAAAVWLAVLAVLFATRSRGPVPVAEAVHGDTARGTVFGDGSAPA